MGRGSQHLRLSRPAMDKKKATKGGAKTKGKKGKKTKKKPDKNLTGDAAAEAKKELVTALMAQYDAFYQKYPSGEITQKEFVDQSHAGIIAEALFRVFDEDKSGELS